MNDCRINLFMTTTTMISVDSPSYRGLKEDLRRLGLKPWQVDRIVRELTVTDTGGIRYIPINRCFIASFPHTEEQAAALGDLSFLGWRCSIIQRWLSPVCELPIMGVF